VSQKKKKKEEKKPGVVVTLIIPLRAEGGRIANLRAAWAKVTETLFHKQLGHSSSGTVLA
jgi:hypothetical protein